MEKQIGDRISEERKKLKLTQNELAEKLMVSNKAVSKWEAGGGCPSIEFLPKLANIFGCTIDYLVMGQDSKKDYANFEIEKFIQINIVSVRRVQEYFKIGYNKASDLVDKLVLNHFVYFSDVSDCYEFAIDKTENIKNFMFSFLSKN